MATWRVDSAASVQWTAGAVKSVGDRVVCRIAYATTTARAFVYECTTGGTTHGSTEPTWPLVVTNTVNDNGVIWTCRSPSDGAWANASCILLYIVNHAYAAGDSIYVDDGHAESVSWTGGIVYTGNTDMANPTRIICVDKAGDTLSVGAVVTNNANQRTEFVNSFYSYGICFKHTGGTNQMRFIGTTGGDDVYLIVFESNGTTDALWSTSTSIQFAPNTSDESGCVKIINAGVRLDAVGLSLAFMTGPSPLFEWTGGTLTAGAELNNLISVSGGAKANICIKDVDLSQLCTGATNRNLFEAANESVNNVVFERCKLPSDSGFVPHDVSNPKFTGKVKIHHCSSANNTYNFWEYMMQGNTEDEITIVRTGGAQHGVTGISYKMISNANVLDNYVYLESPPIQSWTDSTTSKTFTVECIVDSATNLQNDEVWMELEYPTNNSNGLGGFARDKCAVLGTPADKSSSSETWTTTGMANPNKFKCAVTVTPGKAGPITARICLAKASTTIYVCPTITES